MQILSLIYKTYAQLKTKISFLYNLGILLTCNLYLIFLYMVFYHLKFYLSKMKVYFLCFDTFRILISFRAL